MATFTAKKEHLEKTEFKLLPEGEYKLEVINAEEKESQKGKMMINLTFENELGRASDTLVFVEKAEWKITQFLSSMGVNIEDGKDYEIVPNKIKGKTVTALIEHEPDHKDPNKIWARVKRYIFEEKEENPF